MAHNRPDNCLVLRDGASYLLLGYQANSALILRDVQGVGGGGISGGVFSRGRWRRMREEEERQREAARAEKEREEKRKAEAKAKAEREEKEARKAKRLKRDVDAAIEASDVATANAEQAAAGVAKIAEAQLRARLMEEAARQAAAAEAERQAQIKDQQDIEALIEMERADVLGRLHKAGLTSLLRAVKS